MQRSRALFYFMALAGLLGCSQEDRIEEALPAAMELRGGGLAPLQGFVENRGQWPEEVRFFARRGGVEATVLADALAFRPVGAAPLVLHLPGDSEERVVEGLGRLATRHHFLLGERQASDAAGYERVALRDVQEGVDVVLRADGGAFEYDLELAPGAPLDALVIEVEGASALELRAPDTLVLHTEAGEVEQRIRASWQGDAREPVACRFRLLEPRGERQRFGFEAPGWDPELALVLDPSLVWLTYVGGASQEYVVEAEMDAEGAVVLLANTFGATPVTPGAWSVTPQGADVWIGKLSADGSTLEWGTYLGGTKTEKPADIALAPDGTVVVLGQTFSADFPTTSGAWQTVLSQGASTKSDVFVARLSASGSALVWSTYYGGADSDSAWACALYPDGDVLAAFDPFALAPPATAGVIDEVFNPGDLGLFRLSADGTQRLWQTYFRASSIDDMLIDGEGNAYLAGGILSGDLPLMTTPGVLKETITTGDSDAFVSKLNANGTQLLWSTYLGGDPNGGGGQDRIFGLDVDVAGGVYVTGTTDSELFPVTPGAFQTTIPGSSDSFAAKLLPNGTGFAWATYIGAWGFAGSTAMWDIQVDPAGNALVIGEANEPTFSVTPDAFQPVFIGPLPSSGDMLFCKLDAIGEGLVYATWLGGTGTDGPGELVLDPSSDDAVLAFGGGPNLPTTAGAYQASYGGSKDLAVARFDFEAPPWRILGGGLAGEDMPNLVGLGPLTAGSTTRLALRGAPAASPVFLVAGLQQINFPLLGGTLVPLPTVVVPTASGALGELDFLFPWPASPSGTEVFFQAWVLDPLAPLGWAASNGLIGTSL